VEHGEHDFGCRAAALVHVHRNAAAIVDDCHRSVDVDRHGHIAAEAGQSFVDGVVDDFVDEVVQPARASRPDVHRRALADGFQALEDLDFVRTVVVGPSGRTHTGGRRGRAVLFQLSV
jgi:hypothetical protein